MLTSEIIQLLSNLQSARSELCSIEKNLLDPGSQTEYSSVCNVNGRYTFTTDNLGPFHIRKFLSKVNFRKFYFWKWAHSHCKVENLSVWMVHFWKSLSPNRTCSILWKWLSQAINFRKWTVHIGKLTCESWLSKGNFGPLLKESFQCERGWGFLSFLRKAFSYSFVALCYKKCMPLTRNIIFKLITWCVHKYSSTIRNEIFREMCSSENII